MQQRRKSALPTLHSLIGHSKPDVRNWSAKALGAIADGSSIKYLVAGLYNSQTGRRSGFESFVSEASDALSLYPPSERLRALESISQPVELSAVSTVLGGLRSAAAYDLVISLRKKSFLTKDYGNKILNLVRMDADRAWPEIAEFARTHTNDVNSLIAGLSPVRQETLLSMWIDHGPDYEWRFKYMIGAIGEAALEDTIRSSLLDVLEQKIDSYKGTIDEKRKMHNLLKEKRKLFADQRKQ